MRIVVTSNGADLSAPASPAFGRCPMYVFVDTETMAFEGKQNPALNAPGGAGIRAAEFVIEQGAQAVVTGNVGPNAYQVLESAGIPVYLFKGGSVGEAVEAFRDGRLTSPGGASAPAHAGMGRARRQPLSPAGAKPSAATSRAEEIEELKEEARELRKEMASLMDRLEQLEGKK